MAWCRRSGGYCHSRREPAGLGPFHSPVWCLRRKVRGLGSSQVGRRAEQEVELRGSLFAILKVLLPQMPLASTTRIRKRVGLGRACTGTACKGMAAGSAHFCLGWQASSRFLPLVDFFLRSSVLGGAAPGLSSLGGSGAFFSRLWQGGGRGSSSSGGSGSGSR